MLRRIVGVIQNDMAVIERGFVADQETSSEARILRVLGLETRAEEPGFDPYVLEDEHLFDLIFAGASKFMYRTLLKRKELEYLLEDEFSVTVDYALSNGIEAVDVVYKDDTAGGLKVIDLGAATLLKVRL